MKTPSILMYIIETLHVKLGKEWFIHSVKETSVYVPLADVSFYNEETLVVNLGIKGQRFILTSEIKEVQFV